MISRTTTPLGLAESRRQLRAFAAGAAERDAKAAEVRAKLIAEADAREAEQLRKAEVDRIADYWDRQAARFAAARALTPDRSPSIEWIMRAVSLAFQVSAVDLASSRRDAPSVRARHAAMYLSRKLTTRSLPEIGRRMGGRDHTTVLHGVRRVETSLATDAELAERVAAITADFQAIPRAAESSAAVDELPATSGPHKDTP